MKKVVASFLAAVLLAWSSLVYVKLRTTRRGTLWLPLKLAAETFSLQTALVGMAGVAVGAIARSRSVAVGYGLVTLAAGIPVVRTWRTPEVFSGAFGAAEPAGGRRRFQVGRRWGMHLGSMPEARMQRDIPFWIVPDVQRPLLCDIWQPARGIPASGLGFVYLHGSCWTVLDKDCGTDPSSATWSPRGTS
ncbi:MAG: hypothetical protein AB7R89_01005 [Dehalococcoidia bacterium]